MLNTIIDIEFNNLRKHISEVLPNSLNPTIETPDLLTAVRNGDCNTVKYHISNGADVRFNDNQCIEDAASLGHYDVVKLLIENGADIHTRGHYCINKASTKGFNDIISLLIEHGVEPTVNGCRPIRLAISYEHVDTVCFFLENNPTPELFHAAAEEAAIGNYVEMISLIVSKYKYDPTDIYNHPNCGIRVKRWIEAYKLSQSLTEDLNDNSTNLPQNECRHKL